MKLCLVCHAPLPALVALTTFLTRETRSLPFRIQVTTNTGVRWAEDLLWQLRTRAPDGSEREAIFSSVEGMVVRCQPDNALSCVLMCNLLLLWDAWLEQEHEQVRITSTGATLLFARLPLRKHLAAQFFSSRKNKQSYPHVLGSSALGKEGFRGNHFAV